METKPTPTPWKAKERTIFTDYKSKKTPSFVIGSFVNEVDASFVVRTLNVYEKTLQLIADRDRGQAGIEARQALGIKDNTKSFGIKRGNKMRLQDAFTVRKEEDAAFIVKAVNAHEEMLELLKFFNERFDGSNRVSGSALWNNETDLVTIAQAVKQAIARAEGK